MNRPDIDEINDRIEVKKNKKWNYGLSVSKKPYTIVIDRVNSGILRISEHSE